MPQASDHPTATLAERAPRRRSGRPKGTDQRVGAEELVRKCAELLKTMPPAKLSAAAVARHTGVTPALVNYYFKDRGELMLAVSRQLVDELHSFNEAGKRSDETAEEALRRMVRGLMTMHRTYPFFHDLLLQEVVNASTPAGRQLLAETTELGIKNFGALIEQGRRENSFVPDNPLFFYVAVLGMCEFFSTGRHLVENLVPAEDRSMMAEGYADFITNMMLKGFKP